MKRNLMLRFFSVLMLIAAVIGCKSVISKAASALPEQIFVRSVSVEGKLIRETSLSGTFPMTKEQHFRKDIEFSIYTNTVDSFSLYINNAPVPIGYYLKNSNYNSQTGRYYTTITFNNVYNWVDDGEDVTLFKVRTLSKSGSYYESAGVNIQWVEGTKPAAPENLWLEYNNAIAPNQAILWGSTSGMEFRPQHLLDNWTDLTENTVFNLPNTNTNFYVRYKEPQSKSVLLTLKAVPSAPNVKISNEGVLSNISTSMEYRLNDGQYQDVTQEFINAGANEIIDMVPANERYTYTFRIKGSPETPAGNEQVVLIYPRSPLPNTLNYNRVTGILEGSTGAMELRKKGTEKWTACTANNSLIKYLSETEDVIIEVRTKAVANSYFPSKTIEFTLPKLAQAPVLSLDYENEKLSGFEDGAQYEWGTGTLKDAQIVNGTLDISSMISTSEVRYIYVRKKSTDTEIFSAKARFKLPARAAAPKTPSFISNDPNNAGRIVLTGLEPGMEYKSGNDTQWIKCSSYDNIVFEVPESNIGYYFRYSAKAGTAFASDSKATILLARKNAPIITLDKISESFKLNTSMEMRFDDQAEFYDVTNDMTTFNVSEIIDSIAQGETKKVFFRYKANVSSPASKTAEYVLYPRLQAPLGITYNPVTMTVNGLSSQMYYKFGSSVTTWRKLSGTTFSLQSMLSDTEDQIFQVRIGATGNNSASFITKILIPKRPAAPSTLEVDFCKEVVKGFESGKLYQYNTSGSVTSWTNITMTSGNEFDISKILSNTASVNLYIRKAATATEPATAAVKIVLVKRPASPNVQASAVNPEYPEKIVVTGFNSTMEYKKSTDTTWTRCDNSGKMVFDIPQSNITYTFRYFSCDSSTPNSITRNVTINRRGAAPSVRYVNETVSQMKNTMEYRISGESEYTPVKANNSTYKLTSIIDAIPAGETRIFYIRTKAAGTIPASVDKEIVLKARS